MILNKPYHRIRRCKRFPTFYDGITDGIILDINSMNFMEMLRTLSAWKKKLRIAIAKEGKYHISNRFFSLWLARRY